MNTVNDSFFLFIRYSFFSLVFILYPVFLLLLSQTLIESIFFLHVAEETPLSIRLRRERGVSSATCLEMLFYQGLTDIDFESQFSDVSNKIQTSFKKKNRDLSLVLFLPSDIF